MSILRKLGATVIAVAFVGGGALLGGTTAQAATVAPKTVAPKTAVAVPQKAVAKTKYIGRYHLDPRCLKGRVMCINKKTRKLVYLVNGKQVYVLDARFGASRTPTRNGAFKVTRKSKNHVSTLYKSKMPYAMFFSGGQAVHYSSDFKARGYNGASHGCVNIRDKAKLAKIFGQIKVGDKVVVYAG